MIGQKRLITDLDKFIKDTNFPRFTIFVGSRGSGKKTICEYVGKKLDAPVYFSGNKVDDVREVITNAYKCTGRPCIYVFADADNMSPAAKNALLKVTEEPPKNAYIILTLANLDNTYATIRSRGTIFTMNPYSEDEIDNYYHDNYPSYSDERKIVDSICTTPGEVDIVVSMGATDFYAYVEKVVDNISKVSGCNSFKIAEKIKLKESDTNKYDLIMFWKAFMQICVDRISEDISRYTEGIKITSKYLQDLKITGINKASTFDMWILDIRKEWS